ncbi:hypothetical protein [Cellulophaga sp. Z1A5H]|uniref:hypothetical protein n=1 Tax=Cellulophaga sp. Z1A5H TaxID=2687291 RepID=UPI0013FD7957|nr:hypothetical protein [Cellulophaga sp. Z1A5H]
MKTIQFRIFYFLTLFVLILLWSSCRKDFDYENTTGNLSFSKDTVYLDTVFANIGSSTYSLKVYNRSNKDLQIPSITLENGLESAYRINVDGQAGTEFLNVPLLAKDSLYIFIEATFDSAATNQNEFLYIDALRFDTGIYEQKVPVVTLVKDAIFLFPAAGHEENLVLGTDRNGEEIKVASFELSDDQLNFTNEKAYVIYGYATVPKNKTLTIAAGSRVFFHENSGLYIQENSNLHIEGQKSKDSIALENEVIFEGDRLEPEYATTAGQWGTIWFNARSLGNHINYLTVKNANIGLVVNGDHTNTTLNLTLKNTQVYNSSSINLWVKGAFINAENVVLANSGASSVLMTGGTMQLTHATIANYWSSGSRSGYALQITNEENETSFASLGNCIIDGNSTTELSLLNFDSSTDSLKFSLTNCILKINKERFVANPLYDFQNSNRYTNVFFNEASEFVSPTTNNFSLKSSSFALGKGDATIANQVPLAINEVDRTTAPDIGAYQYTFK